MISFVYVQIPPELATEIEQLKTSAVGSGAPTTARDYLKLVDGYDTTTEVNYPNMDIDDWLANAIWWTIDSTSTPGTSPDLGNFKDTINPLEWALYGKKLLTTAIDTGYGGPQYTPPDSIELVSAALQNLKPHEMTTRSEELIRHGHIDPERLPLINDGLEKLNDFYAQALQADHGVIVTPL
jgi:hypothetical protein